MVSTIKGYFAFERRSMKELTICLTGMWLHTSIFVVELQELEILGRNLFMSACSNAELKPYGSVFASIGYQ